MVDLDDLDRGLIAELKVNGRAPVTQLARKFGVTRATINSRLERLIAERIILGFTVRLSNPAEDRAIRAICHLAIEGRNVATVTSELRGLSEVSAMHSTNGEWDIVVELTARSLADLDRVLGHLRGMEGIYRSETSLLLQSERW